MPATSLKTGIVVSLGEGGLLWRIETLIAGRRVSAWWRVENDPDGVVFRDAMAKAMAAVGYVA